MDLYELRDEITQKSLDEKSISSSPIEQFQIWFSEAQSAKLFEPNAMTFATATLNGIPSARMLLLKAFSDNGFTFFSNYDSKKGVQLADNPHAAIVFYWPELERQVRIEGIVEKLSPLESDSYFQTRPTGSRLGAWASPQSRVIEDRSWLEAKHNEFRQQHKHDEIPRPPYWGGYILVPGIIEFWQGRPNRLHDRIEYYRDGDVWKFRRLAP